jgi:hypothetical protein
LPLTIEKDQGLLRLRAEEAKLKNDLQTLEFDLRKRSKRPEDDGIEKLKARIRQKQSVLNVAKLELDLHTAENFPTDQNKTSDIEGLQRSLAVAQAERDLDIVNALPDDKPNETSKKTAVEKAKKILKITKLKLDLYNAKVLNEKPGEESRKLDVEAIEAELRLAEGGLSNEEKKMASKQTQVGISGPVSETNTRRLSRTGTSFWRRKEA